MINRTITEDNYLEFKPSEFIRAMLQDVEMAEGYLDKADIHMDMGNWEQEDDCLPCLGGLACINMGMHFEEEGLPYYVAQIGDAVRMGTAYRLWRFLWTIYDNNDMKDAYVKMDDWYAMQGKADKDDLQELKRRINHIADSLQEQGV